MSQLLNNLGIGTSEIQLVWPNKDLALRASGETGYEWVQPDDWRLKEPIEFRSLTMRPLKPGHRRWTGCLGGAAHEANLVPAAWRWLAFYCPLAFANAQPA